MFESLVAYGMVMAKLGIGLLAIILQINVMGKGNLALLLHWINYRTMFLAVSLGRLSTMIPLVFYNLF